MARPNDDAAMRALSGIEEAALADPLGDRLGPRRPKLILTIEQEGDVDVNDAEPDADDMGTANEGF